MKPRHFSRGTGGRKSWRPKASSGRQRHSVSRCRRRLQVELLEERQLLSVHPYGAAPDKSDMGILPGQPGDGIVDLVVEPGGLVVDTDGVTINGYILYSEQGIFTGDPAQNLGVFQEDTDLRVAGQFGYQLNGTHSLGDVIGDEHAGVDLFGDLTLSYTIQGEAGTHLGTLIDPFTPRPEINVALIPRLAPSPSSLPGSSLPASIESVAVGDTCYLEVWVQDIGMPTGGIRSGTLDLHYTTALADVTEVVSLDFDAAASGGIDDPGGSVDELGGETTTANAGMFPDWARLAYVELVCTGPGDVTFGLSPGDTPFQRSGLGEVSWENVILGEATLHTLAFGSIGGAVFDDLDANGARDAGEPPLEGWSVEVRGVGGQARLQRVLSSPSGQSNDFFGFSVAALGDDLLVGALGDATAGEAYLIDGATGDVLQEFRMPTGGSGGFACAVAALGSDALGSDALVGAARAETAYRFDVTTGDVLQTYRKPSPGLDEGFGYCVAAMGDKVLVGAPRDDAGAANAGAVYLFDAVTGELLRTFANPTPEEDDQFGAALAAVGGNVLIGAHLDDTAGRDTGAAYLFDGDSGELLQTFVSPTPTFQFGQSVAAVGGNVLIGAPFDPGGAEDAGAAYLFDATSGQLLQTFIDPTPSLLGQFGCSVASMGDDVLVGACLDLAGGANAGNAYLFDSATGDLLQTFENPAPAESDEFGYCLAAVGDSVAVGAYRQNSGTGSVYLFEGALLRGATVTDSNGQYGFANLEPGTYRVRQVVPEGFTQTLPTGSQPYTIELGGNEHLSGFDFGNAGNWAPVAAADSYCVNEDTTLVVAVADGVLANDQDADGDELTAELVDPPQHGSVQLEPDGSFTYTPEADFFGTDRFTYGARDGTAASPVATVTITVEPVYEGSLSGMVFDDLDRDHVRDADEPGLADWSLQLQPIGATDVPLVTFENPTPDEWSQFGRFVTAVGDNVLVASHYDEVGGEPDAGAAYLFHGTTGELLRTFTSPASAEEDKFGRAVAALGNNVLIGTPLDNTMAEDAGAVFLLDSETGELLQTFYSPAPRENDQFGRAVAAVGNHVLVGARFADILAADGVTVEFEDAGAAYLFDGQTGELLQTYVSPTPSENAQFGYCVASMGENVLVGARWDETGAEGIGAVYLFEGATGNLLQSFVNPTQAATDEPSGFGRSVVAVGSNVLVGARWDDSGVDGAGAAFLFDGASGELLHVLTSPTPFRGEQFGFCVAALGDDALVGAMWDNRWDDLGQGSGGAAYLFDGSTGQLLQTFANPSPGAWDAFGISVAALGDRVLVGTQTGNAAYLFEAMGDSPVVQTDAEGHYSFSDLPTGTYRIRQASREGYVQTYPAAPGTYTIEIESDEVFSNLDFGNAQDELPTAGDDVYQTEEDQLLEISAPEGVLANDHDADGDPISAAVVNAPPHGTLRLLPDGSFGYTPDPDFYGSDSFTYRANDGLGDSNLATVTITITPVNDAPVACDDSVWVALNTERRIAAPGVLADDFDADGDDLTAALASLPSFGSLTLEADGSFVYQPDPDYAGPDSFTYRASDGTLDSSLATVHITVSINTFDALKDYLRLTELNYNPFPPTAEERAAGFDDREGFEFIELTNLSDQPLDLAGVQLDGTVQFQLLTETILQPGGYAVVVRDPAAFAARYGTAVNVVGQYKGDLHNSGGQLIVRDPFDLVVLDFFYDDDGDWPQWADGFGSSLEIVDPGDSYAGGWNWRASVEYGGSPGRAGSAVGSVVINEVLSHSNLPLTDTIELYNTTDQDVDISGWYLSESAHDLKKFRIPDGTVIPAGQYVLFDERDFNPGRWDPGAGGFAFDSAFGDDVWLMQADAEGNLTHFADHVEFGAALNGESFGRWPNAEGDLYPMRSRTFGSDNSGPRVGPFLISEVMYDPPAPGDDVDPDLFEFVEIYNPTTETIDLRNWRIRGVIDYNFPNSKSPNPVWFPPGETLLVVSFDPKADATRLDAFNDYYGLADPVAMFGPFSGNLTDEGDVVRLLRADAPAWWEPDVIPHPLEDEVRYDDEEPWPATAAGDGHSLHRRAVGLWGNDPASWTAAAPSPGTVDLQVGKLAVTEINYHPHPPTAAELAADPALADDSFEFIELLNIAGDDVDLSGMRLTEGVLFDFPAVTLAAGQRMVIVNDRAAFEIRYGTTVSVGGEYVGSLLNSGERITLTGASGQRVLSFSYGDDQPWPERADGDGSSLELIDIYSNYAEAASWRPSTRYGGSPGEADTGGVAEVVINEVLAHADDPLNDQIELYNSARGPIDVGGWYLSDTGSDPRRFQIPDGTVIEAHGYVVFTGADFNPALDRPGFLLNALEGGQVFLLMTDTTGNVTHFANQADYGAVADGESSGRWPNGEGGFYPMAAPTLTPGAGENSGPRIGPLIINEVMYHPRDPGDLVNPSDLEYIEIYNPMAETVDLAGWQLRGGVEFDFEANTVLAPREALAVVRFDPADAELLETFEAHYGVKPWVDIVGGYGGSLSNRGDSVRLMRAGQAPPDEPDFVPMLLEDEVVFDDEAPWPTMADGFGHSLHRRGIDQWGNAATSWIAAPASPGMVARQVEILAVTELNYHPHDPTPAELAVDPEFTRDDFEFIELLNVAGHPIQLSGMRLIEGVSLAFPDLTLQPAQRVVVAGNAAAFATRYDTTGVLVVGQYDDSLDDNGEQVTLIDGTGTVILSFTYGNSGDWPVRANGKGSSLEILDLAGYYNDPDNWRSSTEYGGSPGVLGGTAARNVLINEVLAHTELPQVDAIELVNTTTRPIDVGGWYLSSSGDDYRKFRIPDGTVVEPGRYVVFDEQDFNPNGPWNPNPGTRHDDEFSLDDAGGQVWLTEAENDKLVRFADEVQYGMAVAGGSFGRWPDGTGAVNPMVAPTLGEENAEAQLSALLVVSELNYHPLEPTSEEIALGFFDADDFEFIELQNTGPLSLDLTGFRLGGSVEFEFTGGDIVVLGPGQFAVVVSDADAFRARYGAEVPVAGVCNGFLSNGGGWLELADRSGQIVLRFGYDDDDDEGWPAWADGDGASLQLVAPTAVPETEPQRTAFLNDPAHWCASGEYGGSPGRAGTTPRTDVVINEVLSHTDPPLTDAIELFNRSGQPVDVGGWYLSDSSYEVRKFRIPDGTVIPAGGYLVFDESDFNPTPLTPGENHFALDGTRGDNVWLMATGADGEMLQIVDQARFGPAAPGESFGRWPDGEGEFYPMLVPTFDSEEGENSGPRIGPLFISELHYHSDEEGDSDDLEFVEIYNPTIQTVNLTNWQLRGGVDYWFPVGTEIAPHGTVVVVSFNTQNANNADRLATFRIVHGIDESAVLVGGYGGKLSNGGEELLLIRPASPEHPDLGLIEDVVVYDDRAPWPIQADGRGASLHRLGVGFWGADADSWRHAAPSPGSIPFAMASQVVGRHVFYNNSIFDGYNPVANAQDNAAVAPDKKALLPGETATFANYTSYVRGINGVMVDMVGLPDGALLGADDFQFRAGNSNDPEAWSAAPQPTVVSVRPGDGVSGSDRVTLIWPDYVLTGRWLQVTVLPGPTTGLAEADVFYFGNAVGEAGNSTVDAKVNASDMLLARNNPRSFLSPAPIDFAFDFNRDARVNATDTLLARNNQTHFLNALRLITAPLAQGAKAGPPADGGPASLHDAVLGGDSAPATTTDGTLWAKADWLYEFDRASIQHSSVARDKSAWDAVDQLLATLY
ncbi:MAG: lamin tail domain-containing protein [Pirellulales bacterium]|nr:lamin tail domain-containing protein [Pirellulales bacterium]